MGTFYEMQIKCDTGKKQEIEKILGKSHRDYETDWHLIVEESSPKFHSALNSFMSIVETNLDKLNTIGIMSEEIVFWYMYEYEQQCNMEFHPDFTRKIGELGIVFCISCWEK